MIILKNYAIIALTATLSFSISLQGASAQNIELTLGELNNGRGPNKVDDDAELPTLYWAPRFLTVFAATQRHRLRSAVW